MLALVALAAVASAPQLSRPSVTPTVQATATATVRIVSGVRLNLHGRANGAEIPVARAVITLGGASQPARLIEFQ